jgi:hypothetical protein
MSDDRNPLPNSTNYIQNRSTTQPNSNFNISGSGNINGALRIEGNGFILPNTPSLSMSSNGIFQIDAPFSPSGRFVVLTNGNVGIGNGAPAEKLDVAGNIKFSGNLSGTGTTGNLTFANGFVTSGTLGSGSIPASGLGTRMMFYPGKAAFRAGSAQGSEWDDVNVGNFSTAFGNGTRADGAWSTAMGFGTRAGGQFSTAMGNSTNATAEGSTATGGFNTASGSYSTALGRSTTAGGNYSTAMGFQSSATAPNSIAMGNNAFASGVTSVAMGYFSDATGLNSIAIGTETTASGDYSTAMGYYSWASQAGSFVYGDSSTTNLVISSAPNSWTVRAAGGYRFFTNFGLTTGVSLSSGGGSWTSVSDRNVKDNIYPVSPREILKRVLRLPISNWNYKGQPGYRHIGPMAQDFYTIFEVGESDKTITTVDPDGVALAAIQGLNEELKDRDKEIERQQQQINLLEEQLKQQAILTDKLISAVTSLQRQARRPARPKARR